MKSIARDVVVRLSLAVVVIVMFSGISKREVAYKDSLQAPRFEVDPMWPKPLPNHWILGNVTGVAVDAHDHIWIVHRPNSLEEMEVWATTNPPSSECCVPAPPVLQFDEEGNLLRGWGDPGKGVDWPVSMHGIAIDPEGNVWLGGNGAGPAPAAQAAALANGAIRMGAVAPADTANVAYHDTMILKFTPEGKFLMQIGKADRSGGSGDVENFKGPAKIWFDAKTNDVYVADGYGNHRVIVLDYKTGQYRRHWGAYGKPPSDDDLGPYIRGTKDVRQFRNPVHCAVLSNDNLLYVCDRLNDRLQIFTPGGAFVAEYYYYTDTLGAGSVWDVAFSRDPQQAFIYLADGSNDQIHILDRHSMKVLTSFGDGGRQPGEFYAVHSIATDAEGNLFTAETFRGQRIQKFLYRGLAPVTSQDQGVLWPKIAHSPLEK